jgi:hypothetical protein
MSRKDDNEAIQRPSAASTEKIRRSGMMLQRFYDMRILVKHMFGLG